MTTSPSMMNYTTNTVHTFRHPTLPLNSKIPKFSTPAELALRRIVIHVGNNVANAPKFICAVIRGDWVVSATSPLS